MSKHQAAFKEYKLSDRYTQTSGRVFLTGTQALVRILYDQSRRDRRAGLNTGGFVSGYRGSPLGALDMELWRQEKPLEEAGIIFQPGVNEDLAVTAIYGSQQVEGDLDKTVDAVFGMWYGKGPGVDRSGDALKHGNAYGSSPHGGVLVVAGDDHGCVSSSMSHQSDAAFLSWFMPVLNPADVGEYLEYGAYGYALSRYSGTWVGFKAISETVESARSVELRPDRQFATPEFDGPEGGLHIRRVDMPNPAIEERLEYKKHAVMKFAEANPIDRCIYNIKDARFGFVTTGKGYLDLMEALRLLGLDNAACEALGIDVYKVGMVWPLSRQSALDFVSGKQEIMIVEEKRGIIESQLKEYFYDWQGDKPACMVGKNDESGERLLPWTGELSPLLLVPQIAKRLHGVFPDQGFMDKAAVLTKAQPAVPVIAGANRSPYFCSGCPHSTSTRVPDGSRAMAGIGCHVLAATMDRKTTSLTQMGGEGVNWTASAKFTGNGHVFQNLGEGTWYHSGSMAIRQAVASGVNITYKVLYNDAVAMTGGQPVDGPVSVAAIANTCRAEGISRIALVSDQPEKFDLADFPKGTTLNHRHDLDAIQRQLREVKGVSVLIYEQACATEKRRRRKRGLLYDPQKFVAINQAVCEGCGDCSTQSNCLSVEPVKTEFGNKRRINLSNCNKDYTCLDGFCPAMITVEGVARRKKSTAEFNFAAAEKSLPLPAPIPLDKPFDLLVTGVGGTGVITVSAIIAMAAHLENKGVSILDFTGFAQKGGTVLSYVRIGSSPEQVKQVRIDEGSADAVIGCDMVVSSSPKATICYRFGTKLVLNSAEMPTGDMIRNRDTDIEIDARTAAIAMVVDPADMTIINANSTAEALLGDSVFANMLLLGTAWQNGLVPASLAAMRQAIEMNGVAIEKNLTAFAYGRLVAADPDVLKHALPAAPSVAETLGEIMKIRAEYLIDYKDSAWSLRYLERMELFVAKTNASDVDETAIAAAKSLFKLMSYKDEYEVARLHLLPEFKAQIAEQFEENPTIKYHMAPPLLPSKKDALGRPRKRAFGRVMAASFKVLAPLKILRGTALDPFGYTGERQAEVALIDWFEDLMLACEKGGNGDWLQIMQAPLDIRGFGPVKDAAEEIVKARVKGLMKH